MGNLQKAFRKQMNVKKNAENRKIVELLKVIDILIENYGNVTLVECRKEIVKGAVK